MTEPLQPDTLLGGRYRLKSILGTGGMGVVWLGRDESANGEVAIKVMHSRALRDPLAKERFLQEGRLLGRIAHPGIVKMIDLGVVPAESGALDSPFIVMELVRGESLEDRIKRTGKLPPEQAALIVMRCAEAVGAAHANGVVHRDIKPPNVMLESKHGDAEVKILDFGIAKLIDPAHDVGLTATGAMIGSLSYMSPEQVRSSNVDARADVWSLGAVLYEALTGQVPFGLRRAEALIAAIMTGEPDPLPDSVPEELRVIVDRALQRDPDDRFESASALAAALRRALGSVADDTIPMGLDSLVRSVIASFPEPSEASPETKEPTRTVVMAPVVRASDQPTTIGVRPTPRQTSKATVVIGLALLVPLIGFGAYQLTRNEGPELPPASVEPFAASPLPAPPAPATSAREDSPAPSVELDDPPNVSSPPKGGRATPTPVRGGSAPVHSAKVRPTAATTGAPTAPPPGSNPHPLRNPGF